MALHHWSVVHPELELELERRQGTDPRGPLPLELLEALDSSAAARAQNAGFLGAYRHVGGTQLKAEFYQRALKLADELEEEAPAMQDRCRVRHAIASYLGDVVVPYALEVDGSRAGQEYAELARKLVDARPIGAWGVDVLDDERREKWANRAGLVKLCPDDARGEAQRASKLYGRRLAELDAQGYVLRYAVFTLPNFPQWELGAGMDAIYQRFREKIMYARVDGRVARSIRDGKRRFPDLVGAWACLEAPLSRLYESDRWSSWNVHLNVLLAFKPSELAYGMPDYGPLNEAWGYGVKWRVIPQNDRNALERAIRELVKYPLQTVAEKSGDRRPAADGGERGPPMVEWPAECFCEWWRAHKGFRRTRSWGMLYRGSLPELDERSDRTVDWLGVIRVTPAEVYVQRPVLSSVERWREARRREFVHGALQSIDPGYRAAVAKRETDARDRERNLRARERARVRLFLIQGNNSARDASTRVVEPLRAARGPP